MVAIFDAGSAVFTLTGRVVREPFDSYGKLVDAARQQKEHSIVLGADVSKVGFDRFAAAVTGVKDVSREAAVTVKGSFDSITGSTTRAASAVGRDMGVMSDEIKKAASSFAGIDDSAKAMAASVSAEANKAAESIARLAEETSAAKDKIVKDNEEIAASSKESAAGGGKGGKGVPPVVTGGGGSGTPEEEAKKATKAWQDGYNTLATMGKWISASIAVTGAVSVKWAADFQKQMELIHTQAGYTQKQVDSLSKSVLNLAPTVGIGPAKLAEGLYHVTSVLQGHGGTVEAMNVLKYAAEGAAVGNANMEDTANALISILASAPKDIHGASDAMAVMNDIVGRGNLRMEDLNKALSSQLLAAAKNANLGLRDVGAALDVMTARGAPAEQSATRLRTLLTLMEKPTTAAQKALAQLGFSQDRIAQDMRQHGLVYALDDLQNALNKTFPPGQKLTVDQERQALTNYANQLAAAGVTGKAAEKDLAAFKRSLDQSGDAATKQSQVILQAFGGARTGATMLTLMENADDVRKRFDALNQAGAAQRFQKDWQATQKNFSHQVGQMWAGIQTLGIKIGDFLIPKITAMVKALIEAAKWIGHHKVIADALAVVFGTVLVGAITAFFTKLVLGAGRGLKSIYDLNKKIVELPINLGKALLQMNKELDTDLKDHTVEVGVEEKGAGGGAGGAEGGASIEGMIMGVGGSMGPGSMENPLVVLVKGGIGGAATSHAATGASSIFGVYGPIEAGGKNNPITTIVYASELFGQGARGAATEAKTASQMEGEAQAIGGAGPSARGATPISEAPQPRTFVAGTSGPATEVTGATETAATAGGAGAEEAAAGKTGLMGKVGGMMGGGGLAGGAGIAGGVAAMGIGSAIGGKAGNVVQGIGGGVASGAGLGMMFGPEGAAIGAAAGGVLGALTSIPGALDAVKKAFDDVGKFISSNLGLSKKDITEFVNSVEKVFKDLEPILKQVWNNIKTYISGALQVIKGLWEIISGIFGGNWNKLWKGVQDVFGGVWKEMGAVVSQAWLGIKTAVSVGIKAVGEVLKVLGEVLVAPFKLAWNLAVDAVNAAKKPVSDAVGSVVGAIKSVFHAVVSDVPNAISDAFNSALKFIKGLPGDFENAAKNIANGIGKGLGTMGGAALSAIKDAINHGIIDPINFLTQDIIDKIHIHVPKIDVGPIHLGGGDIGIPHIGKISYMQTGGFIPGSSQQDGTLVAAAGGELMVTASGQQMMESAAPGLVGNVVQNQLPHPQTGNTASGSTAQTKTAANANLVPKEATQGLTQLGGLGNTASKQLGGVGAAAAGVTKQLTQMGKTSTSTETLMGKNLKKISDTTDTQLKKTHDLTQKDLKDITKLHTDFNDNVMKGTWNTYGGPQEKTTKGGPNASMTATVTDAWNNLKSVTNTTTANISTIQKQAQKTDLNNIQSFGKSYVQTAQQTAHNVVDANVKLAQNTGNVLGQVDDQTYAGIKNIFDQLNKGLSAVGSTSSVKLSGVSSAGSAIGKALTGLNNLIPFATGGILPGSEFGLSDQMTLVDPMGVPRAKMAGDEAIFNRHQMPYVEAGLQALGFQGAADLWDKVNMPHGFERGGWLPRFAQGGQQDQSQQGYKGYALPLPRSVMGNPSTWSDDAGVDIPGPGGTPEFAIGPGKIVSEGAVSGFGPWVPVLQLSAGPLSGRQVYYGHAGPNVKHTGDTVTAGEQISQIGQGIVGISTGPHIEFGFLPFNPQGGGAMHQVLLQMLSGAGVTGVGGIGGGAAWTDIKQPKIKAKGGVADIATGAMKKMTDAANKYGQAHTPTTTAGASAGAFSGTLSGPVEKQVYEFMSANGFNKVAIAGMLGNAEQESSMNPNAPGGGLWQQISNFGEGTGGSLLNQMETMLPQIQGFKAKLNAASSPADAAAIFMNEFEKPGIPALGNRQSAAQAAYAAGYAKGGWLGKFATGGNPWAPLPSYLGSLPGFRAPRTRRGRGGLHTVGKSVGTSGGSKSGSSAGSKKRAPAQKARPKQTLSQAVATTLQQLGLGDFAADQNKLGQLDTLYTNQENLFQMFDATAGGSGGGGLTQQDLDVLMGIREQEWDILYNEYVNIPAAIATVGQDVTALQGTQQPGYWKKEKVNGKTKKVWVPPKQVGGVVPALNTEITNTENQIKSLQGQLTSDTQAIATIHHNVSAEVQSLADDYANQTAIYLDDLRAIQVQKTNNSKSRVNLQDQIRNLPKSSTSATNLSTSQIVSGVMAGTLPSAGSVGGGGNQAKLNLQNQVASLQANDVQLSQGEQEIRSRMQNLLQQKNADARSYRQAGFNAAWAITLKKYKIQDRIADLKTKLTQLKAQLKVEKDALSKDQQALQQLQDWQSGGLQGGTSIADSLSAIVFDILQLYQQGADLPTPGRSTPTMDMITQFLTAQGLQVPTGLTQASQAAAQSYQDFQTFQASRATLFGQFGSNFLPAGTTPMISEANIGAGTQFFGAGAGPSPGTGAVGGLQGGGWLNFPPWGPLNPGETTINIHQNFAAGPPDPHTYSAGLVYELGAMT